MKKIVFTIILINSFFYINAMGIFVDIDKLLEFNDKDQLFTTLDNTSDSPEYYKVESYLIDKAKELILSKQYKQAFEIIETLLVINMDNIDAQTLYISIKSYVDKEKIKLETKKEIDILIVEKVAKIKDEEKARIEEENSEKKKKLKNEFVEFSIDNITFNFSLGGLNSQFFYSSFYTSFHKVENPTFRYGLSTDFNIYYKNAIIIAGISLRFDSFFVSLYPRSSSNILYKISSSFTTPYLVAPLSFNWGMIHIISFFEKGKLEDVFFTYVISPFIGVKVLDYKVNNYIALGGEANYLFASFYSKFLDVSFDASFYITANIFNHKHYRFSIKTELLYLLMVYSGNIESDLRLNISFKVGFNEK